MDYLSKITARVFGSIPIARPISKWVYGFGGLENHHEYVQESEPNFLTTMKNAPTRYFDKENDHTSTLMSSVHKDEDSLKTGLSVEKINSTNVKDPSTQERKKPDKFHSSGKVKNEDNISNNVKNIVVKYSSSANSLSTDFGGLPVDTRPSIDEKPLTTLKKKSSKTDFLSVRNGKNRSSNMSKNVTIEPLRVEEKSINRLEQVKIIGENISTVSPDISPSDKIIQPKFAAANVNSSTASATLNPVTTKGVIHSAGSKNISNSESDFSSGTYRVPMHIEREGTRSELLKEKNFPQSENGLSTNPMVSPEDQFLNSTSMNTTVSPIHLEFSQSEDSDVRASKSTPIKALLLNQLSLKSESGHEGISDRRNVYPDIDDGEGKSFSLTNDITPGNESYSMTSIKDSPKNKEVSDITFPSFLPAAGAPNTHAKGTEIKLPISEPMILRPERPEINKFKDRLKEPQITIDDDSLYSPKTIEEEVSGGSYRGLNTNSDSTLVERHREVELPLPPIFEQARPGSVSGRMPVAELESEEYNIHVNIGTVEVQSEKSAETPYPLISDNPPGPQLSLDDYLKLREGA